MEHRSAYVDDPSSGGGSVAYGRSYLLLPYNITMRRLLAIVAVFAAAGVAVIGCGSEKAAPKHPALVDCAEFPGHRLCDGVTATDGGRALKAECEAMGGRVNDDLECVPVPD